MTANLLSRLQGLSGPSREVDALIWLEFAPGATRKQWSYIHTATGRECHVDETRDVNGRLIIVPELTSSLDAAVALCERVLPGWTGLVDFGGTSRCSATLVGPLKETGEDFDGYPVDLHDSAQGEGSTPAIALLIAILTALEARDAS